MNTFTLSTNNHDASGETVTKSVSKEHIQLVLEYILKQDTLKSMDELCAFKLCNDIAVTEDEKHTYHELHKSKLKLFKQLVDLGVFNDNKWEYRTKWSSEF